MHKHCKEIEAIVYKNNISFSICWQLKLQSGEPMDQWIDGSMDQFIDWWINGWIYWMIDG